MRKIAAMFLSAALCLAMMTTAFAADGSQEYTIPVTLTIVNTVQNIDVTVPASMPVSVVDGTVLTADNIVITNHSSSTNVKISSVNIKAGSYAIGNYDAFDASGTAIALKINGCATHGAGELTLTDNGFPVIAAGGSLAITYSAKVSDTDTEMTARDVASVIFTFSAVKE